MCYPVSISIGGAVVKSSERGRKEMFYLTMHGTHLIYGYLVLGQLVKDHSDIERKPAAATTWATPSDQQQGIFYMHKLVTPIVEHWLE